MQKVHNRQKKYYNKEFKELCTYQLENWRKSYIKRIFSSLELNEPTEDDYYLDVGVGGSGYTVIEAAKLGYKTIGVDASIEGMKKAFQFAHDENVENKCTLVNSYAESLPFKDKVFSKVSIVAVLEHIIDDYQVVKELYRVTKPGGVIFVMVPNTYLTMNPVFIIPYLIHDKKVGHIRHYSLKQVTELFTKEGFKYVEASYTGHLIKSIQLLI